ncbi:hypothetical protein FACS189472_02490 [Alphaproteobacteria bacterium]|nr:hypothetical protein FACS189472_02490 [Alphaproteobacteria bacterium]
MSAAGSTEPAAQLDTIKGAADTTVKGIQGAADTAIKGGMDALQGGMDAIHGTIDSLMNSLHSVPRDVISTITVGMIIVAIFLIIVFFALCIFYINAKPAPVIPKKKKDEIKSDVSKERVRHEDLPIISGRAGEILTLNGLIKAGPVTKMFFQIMEVIKNSTYDLRWRYKLPFFMLVGPEDSGKSTMINSVTLEHLTADGSSIDPLWNLYKQGAIFEFPRMETFEDKNKFWSFISELFLFIRPRRPLDGIIVTLPADMLTSAVVNIGKHAQEMFDRIFAFQREVNLRLPIYLIITKSDLIPGFTEFAHFVDDEAKQQIFGWSNPYSVGNAFSTSWVHEIFDTINEGIRIETLSFSKKKVLHKDVEMAILFGAEFDRLRKPLALYLNTMFQSHNPMDGLLLRGVYFVGKQQEVFAADEELLQPMALSPKSLNNIDSSVCGSYNDEVYFVQDLFSEKIFMESNIANPIRIDSVDLNSSALRNKMIFASSAIILSFGWFYGNHKIRMKLAGYYRSLYSVKSMMVKIKFLEKHVHGPEDQYAINKQISHLLQSIPVISRWDMTSIFVPQSWFSNIYTEVMDAFGLVFDSVVVKAMYIDLNMNAKEIATRPQIENLGDSKDIFAINSFSSFLALLEFSKKVSTLKRISSEYNDIRQLEDRKSVIDITNTIFNDKFDITDEVKTRPPNKKLMPPKFRLDAFQVPIENNLEALFSLFLDEVFSDTIDKIFRTVASDIDRLMSVSKNAAVNFTTRDLAKLYQKTELICDILKNKNFLWISAEKFSPTQKYVDMMNTFGASGVISKNCMASLTKAAEVRFSKFKDNLREYKTHLTDKLLSNVLDAPSEGLQNLQKELSIMLGLPFICAVPPSTFITEVMEDKMLIWDLKKLQELSGLMDKYYEFMGTMPAEIRPQYFDMYKTVARKCFFPTVHSIVGSAELMDDMPLGKSRGMLEDAYKRQADNIKSATIMITKVIKFLDEIFQEDSIQDFGFLNMITSHYTTLLEKIDALFNLETPYSSGDALFDGWTGDSNPRYLNISEEEALKKYLSSQFSRIKFLAKDLASPIVELLSVSYISEKVKRKDLIDKWNAIIASINDYELQKPGNSIAALEAFVSDTLKKVSLESFDQQGEIKGFSETGGDFFIERRSNVAKALLSRADIVQYEKASVAYQKITDKFNALLANKFPFGDSKEDASFTDVEDFVNLYEKNSGNLLAVFEKNKEARQIDGKVIDFLNSMNKLMPFLKTWIAHTKVSDQQNASVMFNVILRPSPEAEALTASVMERIVEVNSNTVTDNTNVAFFNGNKVSATFNWVGSASDKPYKEEAKGNLSINGPSATFSYQGKWALFRMIEQHKMNKDTEYPNGAMLEFDVPVADTKKPHTLLTTKIIMKVTPMARNGDKLEPISWPVFPSSCPMLHKPKPT